ncbi:hypothetical protein BDY21DRAFT_353445 [Lineolata rhizophorae]|uniref:Uncharacterized protein n=1 Tax=Lineolata rhizophorae TaxID=578093 RepID=A0A6A6NRX7_9PEZI|nr:hypothetical protein BDY21DRAFT_353445 [Lineolata rhizophorae]
MAGRGRSAAGELHDGQSRRELYPSKARGGRLSLGTQQRGRQWWWCAAEKKHTSQAGGPR